MSEKKKYALTGDLIELSDLFRRAAAFDQQEAAKQLVKLTRQLGANLTWIYHEYPMSNDVNRQALRNIGDTLKQIEQVAVQAGLKEVRLPLHEKHPDAAIIKKHIFKQNPPQIDFSFRKTDYNKDLSEVGWIHPEIETFLDEGIRGLGAIGDIKYKWDRDIRQGPQLSLEF